MTDGDHDSNNTTALKFNNKMSNDRLILSNQKHRLIGIDQAENDSKFMKRNQTTSNFDSSMIIREQFANPGEFYGAPKSGFKDRFGKTYGIIKERNQDEVPVRRIDSSSFRFGG